jgi:hypothetical protein
MLNNTLKICSSCGDPLIDIEERFIKDLCRGYCEEAHLSKEWDCYEDGCFFHKTKVCKAAVIDDKEKGKNGKD